MPIIKCRYYKERHCGLDRTEFDEDSCLEVCGGCRPPCIDFIPYNTDVYNKSCLYIVRPEAEFEKTAKSYELDDVHLIVGRKHILLDDIEFLEIDGVVKIGDIPQTESTGSPVGDYRDGVGAWAPMPLGDPGSISDITLRTALETWLDRNPDRQIIVERRMTKTGPKHIVSIEPKPWTVQKED